jgi:hypothetical protein
MAQYVIVVAGICGNQLWIPGDDRTLRYPVWLSYSRINDHGLSDLRLASDGVHNYTGGAADLVPSLVIPQYYSRISDYLAVNGYIPVSFVQDWRPTIATVVGDLVKQITELSASQPVHIVAHSNGGLVVREALNQMTPADRAARVGRVVGLGVPHQGSWSAVQMVAGINQLLIDLAWIIGRGSILNVLTGPSYPVRTVVGSWPTGYEMFPNPTAPGMTAGQVTAVYGAGNFRQASWVQAQWIDAAAARWPLARAVPSDVQWLDVVGTGTQTPYRLNPAVLAPLIPAAYDYTADGDGAVPSAWALSGRGNVVSTNAEHSAMVGAAAVHDAVRTWLRS